MSDKAFVAAVALAAAIAFGFVANCAKQEHMDDAEIEKARIEKGLEK